MAAGYANTTNIANHIRELYVKPWADLRDTDKGFLTRLPTENHSKKTYDWKVRDAEYSPVWMVAEAKMTEFLTASNVATDGVGTGTLFIAPNNHPLINATIDMRYGYAGVMVSKLADLVTRDAQAAWLKAVDDETKRALEDLWRNINLQILSTNTSSGGSTGTNFEPLGHLLTTASTTVEGIAIGSFPEWALAADTTTTVLNVGAMQTMRNKLEVGTETLGSNTIRDATIKEIWVGPDQFTNYGNLVGQLRRFGGSETLDAGFATLEFYGKKVVEIPRYPTGYMTYVGTKAGIQRIILEQLDVSDHSQLMADATFLVITHKGNWMIRNRKVMGQFNALT
jgi:hypothetical protein